MQIPMATVGRPAKWRVLLGDEEVQRWFDQLALGSVATAEERVRVLGRFAGYIGMTPRALAELGRDPDGGHRERQAPPRNGGHDPTERIPLRPPPHP